MINMKLITLVESLHSDINDLYHAMDGGKCSNNDIKRSLNGIFKYLDKQLIGESMVGFNKTADITLDDAIRHLEIMDKEYDLDSYTEDVINKVARFLKGV